MIVINNTPVDIVLPSRHRLPTGRAACLPDRVLADPRNRVLVEWRHAAGHITLSAELPGERPAEAFIAPVSRVAVALMERGHLATLALRQGMAPDVVARLAEDDLRLAVAEGAFGP